MSRSAAQRWLRPARAGTLACQGVGLLRVRAQLSAALSASQLCAHRSSACVAACPRALGSLHPRVHLTRFPFGTSTPPRRGWCAFGPVPMRFFLERCGQTRGPWLGPCGAGAGATGCGGTACGGRGGSKPSRRSPASTRATSSSGSGPSLGSPVTLPSPPAQSGHRALVQLGAWHHADSRRLPDGAPGTTGCPAASAHSSTSPVLGALDCCARSTDNRGNPLL